MGQKLTFLFLIFPLLFASCSSNSAEVIIASASVVFDYKTSSTMPQLRFSVFAKVENDVRTAKSVTARNVSSGLEWHCDNPQLLNVSQDEQWVGYSCFLPQESRAIPRGEYEFTCLDMDGETETSSSFLIDYPEELLTATSTQVLSSINYKYETMIAVYSNEGDLVYFGKPREKWKTDSDIILDFKNAVSKRVCYSFKKGAAVMCFMPPVDLGNTSFN